MHDKHDQMPLCSPLYSNLLCWNTPLSVPWTSSTNSAAVWLLPFTAAGRVRAGLQHLKDVGALGAWQRWCRLLSVLGWAMLQRSASDLHPAPRFANSAAF